MKKLLFGAAALTLMFSSCKKDEETTPSNTWKVGATEYTSLSTTGTPLGSQYLLTASTGTGSATNAISFTFNGTAVPTAGTYKVVDAVTAANQISFVATGGTVSGSNSYGSTGTAAINATITVDGGKVKVNMPTVWAKNVMDAKDSVQVSANLAQN